MHTKSRQAIFSGWPLLQMYGLLRLVPPFTKVISVVRIIKMVVYGQCLRKFVMVTGFSALTKLETYKSRASRNLTKIFQDNLTILILSRLVTVIRKPTIGMLHQVKT